ncbi:MAG: hypothetical protein RBT16_03120 [Desulfococcus multivorans]|jgi:hypothetical protein|nr:hypothetical protein [Desulfococcus multivorans]SKA29823.1 hypothetical protein SAMN02745446_03865 [Desulfococcus multivorans DSM 2059]
MKYNRIGPGSQDSIHVNNKIHDFLIISGSTRCFTNVVFENIMGTVFVL